VIGVLRLYGGDPRAYLQDEVAFLLALAEIAGIVILNAKLYERTSYDLSFWETTADYLKE
jgi:GAF domain-containing protein